MLDKKTYDDIKDAIESKVYNYIRLVRKIKGKPDQVIIPFQTTKKIEERLERLDYIRNRINKHKLPPGEYCIECVTHPRKDPLNQYPIVIEDKPDAITHHIEDKTFEQEELMNFNPEDYKETVLELARKEMKIMALEHETKFLKARINELEKNKSKALSDGEENKPATWFDALGKSISENLPEITALADKLLTQRDRQLALAEFGTGYRSKKVSKPKTNKTMSLNIYKRMEQLQENDPEAFDEKMDWYAQNNRPLHDRICEYLEIEVEEEEEEDTLQEGDEEFEEDGDELDDEVGEEEEEFEDEE